MAIVIGSDRKGVVDSAMSIAATAAAVGRWPDVRHVRTRRCPTHNFGTLQPQRALTPIS